MGWFRSASKKKKKKKKNWLWEKEKLYPSIKKQKKEKEESYVPKTMNVRDVYSLPQTMYNSWILNNPDKKHFFSSHFIDNIYKVHRPGKLTNRKGNVPIQEVAKWCKIAKSEGVTDAFVLIPDRDLDEYYAIVQRDPKNPAKDILIKSGKEILFDVYDAYEIKVHHFPIKDFGTPRFSSMIRACMDLQKASQEAEAKNGKVVVHCSAGIGRTGLMTSCYLVYTDRLTVDDIKAVEEDSSSINPKGFHYILPKKRPELSDIQKKIWYDTKGQLDFILDFAELKQETEESGHKLSDPEVIEETEKDDIYYENIEAQKQHQQPLGWSHNIEVQDIPEEDFWSSGPKQNDDDIDYVDEEDDIVRDANGNWMLRSELEGLGEIKNEPNIYDPDLPSEYYTPTWERDRIDQLKKRKSKRDYLWSEKENKWKEVDPFEEEDKWDEQLGDEPLDEIPLEELSDEEWAERFRNDTDFDTKELDKWTNEFDSFYKNKNYSYNYKIHPVQKYSGLFKGSRPGYPTGKSGGTVPNGIVEDFTEELINNGITDIFVFLSDEEIQKYYKNDLFPIYSESGMIDIHHYPIVDYGVPSLKEAMRFAEDLDNVLSSGKKAFLHCSAGIGRTGIMIGVYEIYKGENRPTSYGQSKNQGQFLNDFKLILDAQRKDEWIEPEIIEEETQAPEIDTILPDEIDDENQ